MKLNSQSVVIDANLYSKNNTSQKRDVEYFLNNYLHLVKWNQKVDEMILDVGTGNGETLMDIILPRIPTSISKIVLLDIDANMLKLAKTKIGKNPKIDLLLMDIATQSLPMSLHQNFDHIFSFYCLHWVKNQEQAIKNMYNMLKPEGDLLFNAVVTHPVYNIYEKLFGYNKWAQYKNSIKKFVSRYHASKKPIEKMETYLRTAGFVNYKCDILHLNYVHPNLTDFLNWCSGIDHFRLRVSEEDRKEYQEDFVREAKRIIDVNMYDKAGEIQIPYQIIIVYASKSTII